MWRKENTRALLVGMQTGAATLKNHMEVPQKVKNRNTLSSRVFALVNIYPQYINTNSKAYMHPDVTKLWKQPKYPLTDERIKKWYI